MKKVTRLIAVLIVLALLPIEAVRAQQPIDFPELAGPYQVGRMTYHLTDETRAEVYSDDPDAIREVMVTIFYPAEPAAGAVPAPYVDPVLRDAIEAVIGLPGAILDQIHSHAYDQAPAVQDPFPVLIFSPGGGVNGLFYTALCEEIASHGYVVVNITHPYDAPVTVFPDGWIVSFEDEGVNLYADVWGLTGEQKQTLLATPALQRIGALQGMVSEEQMTAALDQYYNVALTVRSQDVLFVLEQLIDLNDSDPVLAGHLDFERLGVFGHSLGGAAAANVMAQDSRFKAGIDLDGSLFGAKDYTLSQPFMLMMTDSQLAAALDSSEAALATIGDYCDEMGAFYARLSPGYLFTLSGFTHTALVSDFTLAESVYPQAFGGLTSGIDPVQATQLVNTYVRTFFDQYLNGVMSVEALDFPEVQAGPEACRP